MPVPLDEYPIHQGPESMKHFLTSDRNVYDRCIMHALDRTGEHQVAAGLGVYPGVGVIDCYVAIRQGRKLTALRTSGSLGDDRMQHAEQHGDLICTVVRGHEIQNAIAVQIPGANRMRRLGRGEGERFLERAIAIAEQDAHRAVGTIGVGQIGNAIAIEIAHHQRRRLASGMQIQPWLERAIAVAEEHAGEIGLAVTKHDRMQVDPILIDQAQLGEAARQLRASDFNLPVALGLQFAHGALEIIRNKAGVGADRLQ